ncbi:hypothetical protein CNQ82_05405 [Staphylococcus debuckii]|nr:hypothetical protein CNQ82_05405 [Staphylococcus debuckii]
MRTDVGWCWNEEIGGSMWGADIGHVCLNLGQYTCLLDTLSVFLANIFVYWTCCIESWPIYLFIGHVAPILGRYIRLLDTKLIDNADSRH